MPLFEWELDRPGLHADRSRMVLFESDLVNVYLVVRGNCQMHRFGGMPIVRRL